MTEEEIFLEALVLWGNVDNRLGALSLSYIATLEKINEVAATHWMDQSLSRLGNKLRMKEVGGAAIQYNEFLHETAILSLDKVVDDTARDLKKSFNFKFDSFSNHHGVQYVSTINMIRCLSNVIKHNGSHLLRGSSKSATFLVDECGMVDGWDFGTLILAGNAAFNVLEHIPKIYFSMTELVSIASGKSNHLLELTGDALFNKVYEILMPDVVPLPRPQKSVN